MAPKIPTPLILLTGFIDLVDASDYVDLVGILIRAIWFIWPTELVWLIWHLADWAI